MVWLRYDGVRCVIKRLKIVNTDFCRFGVGVGIGIGIEKDLNKRRYRFRCPTPTPMHLNDTMLIIPLPL